MIRRFVLLIPFTVFATSCSMAQSSEFYNYIEKYKKIAVKEMERAGVPASIKLAQGLLESNAGRSTLAKKANNHFGMKCGSSWKGKTYHREDDDYDEFGNLKKSCFRVYRRASDCYIAHSEFLRDPKKAHRYGFLFRIDATNYKRWARGLKKAGYATAANYDQKLIKLIEEYQLDQYDKLGGGNFSDRPEDAIAGLDLRKINDIKVVFAKNKITVQDIAFKSGVSINALQRYNENLPAVADSLDDGYRVFLQPKRGRHRGKRKWHYVKEGETMFDLSQEYGVKLSKLYRRNRMPEGSEPQVDERIKLKGWRVSKGERPRLLNEPKPDNVPVIIDDEFMEDDITPDPPTPVDDPFPDPDAETNPSDPQSEPSPEPAPGSELFYTVVKGDTLYSISRRNGLTVDQLMRMNNLTSTTLSIGQVLKVK